MSDVSLHAAGQLIRLHGTARRVPTPVQVFHWVSTPRTVGPDFSSSLRKTTISIVHTMSFGNFPYAAHHLLPTRVFGPFAFATIIARWHPTAFPTKRLLLHCTTVTTRTKSCNYSGVTITTFLAGSTGTRGEVTPLPPLSYLGCYI